MIRHCRARQELHKRISDGEIGDMIAMRAYRMHGPVGSCFSTRKPKDRDELPWQIERFHSFLWASGGLFNDFYVHQIDEVCWMKNAWPVKAQALGGRHFRGDYVDQNFDNYSVEYTFDDGTKFFFDGRTMIGTRNDMSSVVHGTKGSGIVSTSGHFPGKCRIFKDQHQDKASTVWAYPQPEQNPYTLEWKDLIEADHGGQAAQRSAARRAGLPGIEHGPHGRPHRAGNHLRSDSQLPARNGPRRRRLYHERPRPGDAECRRQVPGAHAGSKHRSRIRYESLATLSTQRRSRKSPLEALSSTRTRKYFRQVVRH